QEFASVRRLGDQFGVGALTDQCERLRRARHHRTSMTVTVDPQRPVSRRRAEFQLEIFQRLIFYREQYRAPFRINDRDGGITADSGYPVLRLVSRGEPVAAPTVLVLEPSFQLDQFGFQRASVDRVESPFGMLDGFDLHSFEYFVVRLL